MAPISPHIPAPIERATIDATDALLAIRDEETLEKALSAAEPTAVIRAICVAPSLEQKTEMLWALEDRPRREILDALPPALVGALVQNLEEDNRYLLGDVSLEQFRALLGLCSPERKYYWLTTALSFTDVRANALPLLMPTRELVEILLTRSEFEEHLRALADYPIEHARIPADLMTDPAQTLLDLIGPENLLREFPIAEPSLAHLLQTILDYDQDRYVDLIREGLRLVDYQENHPLEWETLTEDPVLLSHIERPEAADASSVPDFEAETLADAPAVALVPVTAGPLAVAAAALPPAQQNRVGQELQQLFVRQAIAEGGSFHRSDLERIARSTQAYLLLGLRLESGGEGGREAGVLGSRPLHKVSASGARMVETLRQAALRLGPLEKVLSPEQRAVIRSVTQPRLTLDGKGNPSLFLLPGGDLPESIDLPGAARLLQEVAAWTSLARVLGLERTETALSGGRKVPDLILEAALAAVLFGQLRLGVTEPSDEARFRARYVTPGTRQLLPTAREGLARTVRGGGSAIGGDAEGVIALLADALEKLAEE